MKKKKMLLSILAIAVVAVILFLLFRNKTREGNSGGGDLAKYTRYTLKKARNVLRDDITKKSPPDQFEKDKIQKLLNKYIIIKEGDKYSVVWKKRGGQVLEERKKYNSFNDAKEGGSIRFKGRRGLIKYTLLYPEQIDTGGAYVDAIRAAQLRSKLKSVYSLFGRR
jgi:hypothetical protein